MSTIAPHRSKIKIRKSKISFSLCRLRSAAKPFRLHFFPRLRSTNDHAAALRRRGDLFAPAIVLAARQTAGRGRGGNGWWSGPGCLTVTFVVPIEHHLQPQQVPLVAGLAVRDAAAELVGRTNIQLKWPNDIVCNGRKLAGLLCERIQNADLIGLGLNVNLDGAQAPPHLRGTITALSEVAGQALDMTTVLTTVAGHLHRALARRNEQPFAGFVSRYNDHHALNGRRVTIIGNGGDQRLAGRCEGIDALGRLILRDRTRLHRVNTGQVLTPRP